MKSERLLALAALDLNVFGSAATPMERTNRADAKDAAVAILQARGYEAAEAKDIVNLVARGTFTVTASADCGVSFASYGEPSTTTMSTVYSTYMPPAIPTTGSTAATVVTTTSVAAPSTTSIVASVDTASVATTEVTTTAVTTSDVSTAGTTAPPETITPPGFSSGTETTSETTPATVPTSSETATATTDNSPPAPTANVAGIAGAHVGLALIGLLTALVMA